MEKDNKLRVKAKVGEQCCDVCFNLIVGKPDSKFTTKKDEILGVERHLCVDCTNAVEQFLSKRTDGVYKETLG